MMITYDTLIIGGGVIGLSVLHTSLRSGYTAILLERNPHICDGASGRNSGVLCTGVDAPMGSLERALIRDSISRVREFCGAMNVPMRECGSLVCLWPWDVVEKKKTETEEEEDEKKLEDDEGEDPTTNDNESLWKQNDKLKEVLHESHIAGDTHAVLLSPSQLSRMEPALSSECRGAVHIPGETVVDPWLFPLALAVSSREMARRRSKLRENCAQQSPSQEEEEEEDVIRTGWEVVMESSHFDEGEGVWHVVTRRTNGNDGDENDTVTIKAKCIINVAGIHSDLVQQSASSASSSTLANNKCKLPPPTFEARPRRGQYVIFAAPKETILQSNTASQQQTFNNNNNNPASWPHVPNTIPTRPIQPVPSQFTKGIFVYSTLYDQIVVGPTAQDQMSRNDDAIDSNVRETLVEHALRILGPSFHAAADANNNEVGGNMVGEYVGIRPGTSSRDYQIHLHPYSNFITVGGIRSTGLTASLGIGRHVVQCLLPSIVAASSSLAASGSSSLHSPSPLPNVKEMVEQFHQRNDGTIEVDGHAYRVTHPLTRLGWEARTGLANIGER